MPTEILTETEKTSEPVHYSEMDKGRQPEEGIALCLSGGGYRAMLFHTGVLSAVKRDRIAAKTQ